MGLNWFEHQDWDWIEQSTQGYSMDSAWLIWTSCRKPWLSPLNTRNPIWGVSTDPKEYGNSILSLPTVRLHGLSNSDLF